MPSSEKGRFSSATKRAVTKKAGATQGFALFKVPPRNGLIGGTDPLQNLQWIVRMITYKSRFLTRAEVWFDHEPTESARRADWILYHLRSQPVPGAQSRSFYTLLVDLSQTQQEL